MDEAVREIAAMQKATTIEKTDAWYACNRVMHILWKLGEPKKL
jgi:hypothetical protein